MINPSNNPFPAFTLLAKPTGAACNLACKYCFYLDKKRLYADSHMRMSDEVLKAYIIQTLTQPATEVSISWQGGEPTLIGLDFFRHSIELVKKYKRPAQHVTYTLQTNGTLLNDEWCAFFKKHDFLIGLSIDGTKEMHDAYRVNKGGQGSFDLVRQGWELLQRHQVDTNILCAVHSANGSHPREVYRFFRDTLHAQYIQLIPIVEHHPQQTRSQVEMGPPELPSGEGPDLIHEEYEGNFVSRRSVKPDQYGTFLIEIFDEWVHRDVGTVFIQAFDSALASWCHLPASVCVFQEVCGASLILEHNGDLYSCDHFVAPAYRLGNILEDPMAELVSSFRQRQFGVNKRDLLPGQCIKCDVRFACQGECPRNRFIRTPNEEEAGLNYLCPSYKSFFRHIDRPMRIMADLLRQGRAPDEIMQMSW